MEARERFCGVFMMAEYENAKVFGRFASDLSFIEKKIECRDTFKVHSVILLKSEKVPFLVLSEGFICGLANRFFMVPFIMFAVVKVFLLNTTRTMNRNDEEKIICKRFFCNLIATSFICMNTEELFQ